MAVAPPTRFCDHCQHLDRELLGLTAEVLNELEDKPLIEQITELEREILKFAQSKRIDFYFAFDSKTDQYSFTCRKNCPNLKQTLDIPIDDIVSGGNK